MDYKTLMGYGKKIDVKIKNNSVSVRDYGRGIPLGKVHECVSKINTGGKYDSDVFQKSVGLNGVVTKAVNALSEKFSIQSIRDNKTVFFLENETAIMHASTNEEGPSYIDALETSIPLNSHIIV